MPKRIFISYATEDSEAAEKLYDRLSSEGFDPRMDRRDLLPDQNWRNEIPRVIRNSEHVVFLLSPRSLTKRGFVQKELKLALEILDEFPPGEIFLVPVKLEPCKPEDSRLADIHWVELFPSWERGFSDILRALRHGKPEAGRERSTPRPAAPERKRGAIFNLNANQISGVVQAENIEKLSFDFFRKNFSAAQERPANGKRRSFQETESPAPAATARPESPTVRLLHLSDLHFETPKKVDTWFSQLADDLKRELGCDRLDSLVVTGDVACRSLPEEYDAARIFIRRIFDEFGVGPSRTVVVPGNHDLNWDISKFECYCPEYRSKVEKNLREGEFIVEGPEIVAMRIPEKYHMRFRHFSDFYRDVLGEPYPPEERSQAVFCHLKQAGILIVGLNSAWETDHHVSRKRASIHPDAISDALDRIRLNPQYRDCLKFAAWHHPVNSPSDDRIRDEGFLERLAQAGFSVALHGHMHKARSDLFQYDKGTGDRKISIVGAGTFGAPFGQWTPGHPLQYNLLKIEGDIMTVETRRRVEIDGAWAPDAIWLRGRGKDPAARYEIKLPRKFPSPPKPESPEDSPPTANIDPPPAPLSDSELRRYCEKAAALHEKIDMVGFRTRVRARIGVEEIYIPLDAVIDDRAAGKCRFLDAEDAVKCLEETGVGKRISLPDAFLTSEKLGKRGMVILGDPGSGKTTHLKRLMLWCLRGGLSRLGLAEDLLPVFLPLRELRDTNKGLPHFVQSQLHNPHLDPPPDFGKRLLERGRLLFLLDGLDEVADSSQRDIVARWIEDALACETEKNCRFVVTCRFMGYTEQARLNEDFMELHVRPLSETQAEDFVSSWYRIVEEGLSEDKEQARIKADEGARDLVGRLKEKEFRSARVFELTRNPLLLANICLVHRDRGGRLPKRRARLYDECLDVLLELWQCAKKLPVEMEAPKSRRVLQSAAYWLHQEEGRVRADAKELAKVIGPVLETVGKSKDSAEDFLRAIRDGSGLLTGWDQENFGFMHLGFQEYLTALEIRRRAYSDPDVLKDLASRFGQSWWLETSLLFLALDNPCPFGPFMTELVKQPAFALHPDLVDLCVEDAAEVSLEPFETLLKIKPGKKGEELWERQFAALRVLARLDGSALENLKSRLSKHPYEKIRRLWESRPDDKTGEIFYSNPGGYELVKIPGGEFMMGAPESELEYDWEKPVHLVKVKSFYMGRYPVTNEQYAKFLEAVPGSSEPEYWSNRSFNQPNQPVVGVSWQDARAYAEWAGLRLPSEAEWEYACRAGSKTKYCNGDSEEALDRVGWYDKNSGARLHPVGEKEPNEFGLYDMHGNVWEWVEDDWHSNYNGAPEDGCAWIDHPKRVARRAFRGGGFGSWSLFCRSAFRLHRAPALRLLNLGFRLARS